MWLFRLARAWLYFGSAVGGAYLLGTAALYSFVLSAQQISFNVTQLAPNILEYFYPVIVIGYVGGISHGLLAVRTVYRHLQRCWLSRHLAAIQPRPHARTRAKHGPPLSSIVPTRQPQRPVSMRGPRLFTSHAHARAVAHWIWLRKRWIRYRSEIVRLFMLWEVANQTYQANKMSELVASRWINRLVSLVIVVNCWFSPVLHYVMHGRRSIHVRLARLLLDSFLDVVYSIGIPIVIFYPYYRDYVDSFNVFPAIFYYRDAWYVNALSELRQVFVTSWVDLVSKTTGSIALLHRLYVLENVLKDAQDPHFVSRRGTTAPPDQVAQETAARRLAAQLRSRMTKILDAALVCWGFAVLGLHLHSTIVAIRGDSMGCLLETQPWGSSTYSCMVLEVSCQNHGMLGDALSMTDALDNVDPQALHVLILSHCRNLEMPTIFRNFSVLGMLKVYNSTIQSWGEGAAIRAATHPSLQVLFFARVNMSSIPVGLLAQDFPASIWDIEFCVTNLSTFPDDVTVAWRNVVYFVIEASPLLTEVPDAILRLPSVAFYLFGMDTIRAIRDDVFADRALAYLFLDGNPIDRLPSSIKTLEIMHTLSIRHSNISHLPTSWLHATPPPESILVLAAGSPLCATTAATATGPHTVGPFRINCHDDDAPLVSFPIAAEDAWRAATTSTHCASTCT